MLINSWFDETGGMAAYWCLKSLVCRTANVVLLDDYEGAVGAGAVLAVKSSPRMHPRQRIHWRPPALKLFRHCHPIYARKYAQGADREIRLTSVFFPCCRRQAFHSAMRLAVIHTSLRRFTLGASKEMPSSGP